MTRHPSRCRNYKNKDHQEFGARQKDVGNDSGEMFANLRGKSSQNNKGGKHFGPSHNGASDKGQSKPKRIYKCKYCNRKGHKEFQCYSKKRDMSAKEEDAESANYAFFTGRATNADELWCIAAALLIYAKTRRHFPTSRKHMVI